MNTTPWPFENARVAETFASYDGDLGQDLLKLRQLVLKTAAETADVGAIEEDLRWGQPSFLTAETGSGSTIRVAPTSARSPYDYGLFFICHTNLVESIRDLFGDTFSYDGDRALLFNVGDQLPVDELRVCIRMALTYHLARR